MNTDVNYNPFAAARSLSLQFMIQAVTTSFDPILVMLIFSHNGSKSVWFNCANCVRRGVAASAVMCLYVWPHPVCHVRLRVVAEVRGVVMPTLKLSICILMSLACHTGYFSGILKMDGAFNERESLLVKITSQLFDFTTIRKN